MANYNRITGPSVTFSFRTGGGLSIDTIDAFREMAAERNLIDFYSSLAAMGSNYGAVAQASPMCKMVHSK